MIVEISDELDLDVIVNSGQCFRPRKTAANEYQFIHKDKVLLISQRGIRTFEVNCSVDEWTTIWAEYFDLQRNYETVRSQVLRSDRYLSLAAESCIGLRILHQDPWETLISFIVSQRKSIPAIKKSIDQLCFLFGNPLPTTSPDCCCFPSAEVLAQASREELAKCGLGYRVQYIQKTAAAVASGAIDLYEISALSDEALKKKLMTLPGVGEKVANCVCLFSYSRTNCAPIDVWISRILDLYYHGKNPFILYPENAGILQQYMFVYAQRQKATIRALEKQ